MADTSQVRTPPYGVDAPMCLHCREARWCEDRRDEDHARSAWSPHSYENIYYLHEYYESVELSRQIVEHTCLPPALVHKMRFPYECLRSQDRAAGAMHSHAS